MAKIHLLPEFVVNQIAAGEVIERPASIIKELVENSIDAQASRIIVKFNNGGDQFLSVTDDGIGMDEVDAAMAFERNTTSKLAILKDLESLVTFGFRGEAVASIASVAKMTMQTNDGNGGTEIRYDFGKKIDQRPCGCRRGTQIEICDLFGKIPARKRFLKSIATEAMHILKIVRAFILIEPKIHFTLYKNGKLILSSPDSLNLQDRVETILGHFDQYTPLESNDDSIQLKGILFEHAVDGIVSQPDFLIFVNRRYVSNSTIVRVVRDTYAMIKSRNINMGAVLFLECQDGFVDFNVHPQKKEVRFKSDYFVKKFIADAVANALQRKITTLQPTKEPYKTDPNISNLSPSTINSESSSYSTYLAHSCSKTYASDSSFKPQESIPNLGLKISPEDQISDIHNPYQNQSFKFSLPQDLEYFPEELSQDNKKSWHFVGMFWDKKFAIFEIKTGLIFVDLTAAQRCILWNKLLHNPDPFVPQLLLIPRMITVTPEQASVVDTLISKLSPMGIEIECFGKNIYKITALPREISEETILQLLQDPSLIGVHKILTHEEFAQKICTHLQFQPITPEEVMPLIEQLFACSQFMISPNHTSVLFEMDRYDLEKKFGLQLTPK